VENFGIVTTGADCFGGVWHGAIVGSSVASVETIVRMAVLEQCGHSVGIVWNSVEQCGAV